MMHLNRLRTLIPDLDTRSILDVGAGKGSFVIAATRAGFDTTGLEPNPAYIKIAEERAAAENISINLVHGEGEELPFPDASFDFINLSEVIEHVKDPRVLMQEVSRVLAPGGKVYVSMPNRYGMRDQHFHLYGVNWIPRQLADSFIGLFGKHKDYTDLSAGHQRLADMHYYTFGEGREIVSVSGFTVEDIRIIRIREMPTPKRLLAQVAYPFLRAVWFDSFHLLLTKPGLNGTSD